MRIRKLRPDDRDEWLRLREALWPDFSREEPTREEEDLLAGTARDACVLVAAPTEGPLAGFVEVSLRPWAEGCATRPVGYLEAWYVDPPHRRAGTGRRLVEAAEGWARERGCAEMASDTEVTNETSHRAHGALGYAEVMRIVAFRKKLSP